MSTKERFWSHSEEVIAAIMLFVMAWIAFINVITRYFIKYSLAFTEELEVNLFVWMTVLGIAIAFKRGSHLSVSILVDKLPLRWRKFSVWLAAILTIFVFSLLIVYGIFEIQDEIDLGITTESLSIPVWWYTMGVPIGSLIVIIRVIQMLPQYLKKERERNGS
ncbi:MAG: TRAP transporter small permease [Synergistetes bacterium]|nr:TRAP transporter small permease [Synergistota bacterium]